MKNENNNPTENKNADDLTPIRDGDTRPDQNIEGTKKKSSSPLSSEKRPTTKERAADVNSLEDYKDAKI